jgi:hypothetical protein
MRETLPSSLAGRHAPLGGRQAAYPESRRGIAVPPGGARGHTILDSAYFDKRLQAGAYPLCICCTVTFFVKAIPPAPLHLKGE